MSVVSHFLKNSFRGIQLVLAVFALLVFVLNSARADTSYVSPRAIQQAMDFSDHVSIYNTNNNSGFNFGSSYYSGLASGIAAPNNLTDPTDQKLYALLIDGRYDFNHELSSLSSSALHPYVSSGMGMATAGGGTASGTSLSSSGDTVPMFRVGGGVTYRMDEQWNLSLDYEAGHAAMSSGDQVFTGRSQQSVDLQALNLGMRYSF